MPDEDQIGGDTAANTAELGGPDAAEVSRTGAVVDRNRYEYSVHKETKTASGRASVDNNDDIAASLRGMTVEGIRIVLEDNGGTWNTAWDSLNPGLARMSAGNVIRRIAKTQPIEISDKALATIPVVEVKPPVPPKVKAEKPPKSEKVAKVASTLPGTTNGRSPRLDRPKPAPSKADLQAGLASKPKDEWTGPHPVGPDVA